MSGFLSMGGYAAYVWPAYALALIVIGAVALFSVRALRAREAEAKALEAARPRRRSDR
jgi:heme exporter protein D